MDPASIWHWWVKPRIVPTVMDATVTAMCGSYRQCLRSVAEDVENVFYGMLGCYISAGCFGDAGTAERQLTVEKWFGIESDREAIINTADADFFRESSDGEAEE